MTRTHPLDRYMAAVKRKQAQDMKKLHCSLVKEESVWIKSLYKKV